MPWLTEKYYIRVFVGRDISTYASALMPSYLDQALLHSMRRRLDKYTQRRVEILNGDGSHEASLLFFAQIPVP